MNNKIEIPPRYGKAEAARRADLLAASGRVEEARAVIADAAAGVVVIELPRRVR